MNPAKVGVTETAELFLVVVAWAVSSCILKTPQSRPILLFDFSSVHSESLTVHSTFFQPTGIATE